MDCQFIYVDGNYICSKCGFKYHKEVVRECVIQPPKLQKRVQNFTKSLIKHQLHGRPKCSEEETQKRFQICQTNECGLYKKINEHKGICSHSSCGCNLLDEKVFLNKLAWADQECPVGKWGKANKNGV